MANCRVRRAVEARLHGKVSNSSMQETRSCTTAHPLASVSGRIRCAFSWPLFDSSSAARILATLFTFLECTNSRFSFWRMESHQDFILLPLFMVHSIHISQAMLACDRLSKVRSQEGNLVSRETCKHRPKVR